MVGVIRCQGQGTKGVRHQGIRRMKAPSSFWASWGSAGLWTEHALCLQLALGRGGDEMARNSRETLSLEECNVGVRMRVASCVWRSVHWGQRVD